MRPKTSVLNSSRWISRRGSRPPRKRGGRAAARSSAPSLGAERQRWALDRGGAASRSAASATAAAQRQAARARRGGAASGAARDSPGDHHCERHLGGQQRERDCGGAASRAGRPPRAAARARAPAGRREGDRGGAASRAARDSRDQRRERDRLPAGGASATAALHPEQRETARATTTASGASVASGPSATAAPISERAASSAGRARAGSRSLMTARARWRRRYRCSCIRSSRNCRA